jgi:hypothetical protein
MASKEKQARADYAEHVIRCLPRGYKQKMAKLALQGITLRWRPNFGEWRVFSHNEYVAVFSINLVRTIDLAWNYAEHREEHDEVRRRAQEKRDRLWSSYGGGHSGGLEAFQAQQRKYFRAIRNALPDAAGAGQAIDYKMIVETAAISLPEWAKAIDFETASKIPLRKLPGR